MINDNIPSQLLPTLTLSSAWLLPLSAYPCLWATHDQGACSLPFLLLSLIQSLFMNCPLFAHLFIEPLISLVPHYGSVFFTRPRSIHYIRLIASLCAASVFSQFHFVMIHEQFGKFRKRAALLKTTTGLP